MLKSMSLSESITGVVVIGTFGSVVRSPSVATEKEKQMTGLASTLFRLFLNYFLIDQ